VNDRATFGSLTRFLAIVGDERLSDGPATACDAQRMNHSLHPLLAGRWSPTRFDPAHEIAEDETEVLLQAARWAPSAGNSQPWAFIVARRGTADHGRLIRYLAGSSAAWAPSASLLVANLSHRLVEDTDWQFSEFSVYDLGQAVAHMSIQAQALGLHVRQFRAFDRDGIAREFAVPEHWEVTTLAAIGRAAPGPGRVSSLEDTGESSVRSRRALDEIVWPVAQPPGRPNARRTVRAPAESL
jgi:nitroreductase